MARKSALRSFVPDPSYARVRDVVDAISPILNVQVEGKPHLWHHNICKECGVTPDYALEWCTNAQLRKLFNYQPKRGLKVPIAYVNMERLVKLHRGALWTEAQHLCLPVSTEATAQELRRAIYTFRAKGLHLV